MVDFRNCVLNAHVSLKMVYVYSSNARRPVFQWAQSTIIDVVFKVNGPVAVFRKSEKQQHNPMYSQTHIPFELVCVFFLRLVLLFINGGPLVHAIMYSMYIVYSLYILYYISLY